jgi:predicted signal transduction protein with EAL and GGDEF domain
MYLAKEEGKNDFRFFSSEIKPQSIERLMLEADLRHALELDQFTLHYQPKLDVRTGRITGLEALLRWTHPELGDLPPMQFISLAEETGLIIPIGLWVLKTACMQNMAWQRDGLPAISMAVNLSPRQFLDDNLLRDIDEVLISTGMPAHQLQLEITESMVMQNVGRAVKLLDQIQSRGVRLAIDDFGTGYSSKQQRRPRNCKSHHQHGQGLGPDGGCRRCRDSRTGCLPERTRMRRTSGLPVQQADPRGIDCRASSSHLVLAIASAFGFSIVALCA